MTLITVFCLVYGIVIYFFGMGLAAITFKESKKYKNANPFLVVWWPIVLAKYVIIQLYKSLIEALKS